MADCDTTVPPSTFELALRVYDSNGDGLVDKSEFVQIMKMLRARTSQVSATLCCHKVAFMVCGHHGLLMLWCTWSRGSKYVTRVWWAVRRVECSLRAS